MSSTILQRGSHLVALQHGWSLWRSVCLRGAGFPARRLTELAAPECAAAVDEWLGRQTACEQARSHALQVCEAGNRLGEPGAGSALTRAMKAIKAHTAPEPFDAAPQVAAAIGQFEQARQDAEEQAARVHEAFSRATLTSSEVLRHAASDTRLRTAILWQNRKAVKGTVDALLRKPPGATDSKAREHERLVASYLQRYCAKNDTIGFFGPVGWGSIADGGPALELRPGPQLLAKRTVYFETWGVQLLAAQLAEDPELRKHIAPRRAPTVRLEGVMLHHSRGRATELPLEYARILAACDGERSASEIAALVGGDPTLGLSGPDEVFALIEQLVEKRVLTWTLEIPTTLAHPERGLRALIERAPACAAREQAQGAVRELMDLRDGVAAAHDDEAALDTSIAAFEQSFERITGAAAQRRGGQAYAGRTLLFEDCVRDVHLQLGAAFVDRLGPPLELLLQAARWYTFEIGRRYHAALLQVHARLREQTGSNTLEFVQFLTDVEGMFTGNISQPGSLVREVIDELHTRWARILALPPSAARVEHSAAELRAAVERVFAAPHPGWPGARYHSPDILIAASSADAIQRGEYQLVMGELHTGDNTASNPVFIHQHPDPSELVRAVEQDLSEARICPVVPKERSTRADQISLRRADFDVEFGTTRSARPRGQVLAASELVVEYTGDTLYVRTRDAGQRFHVLAFFENYLKLESIAHFTLLPAAAHSPRVTIGGLVVARERWRFQPAQLGFASEATPLERFVAARRWAAGHGLPRLLFVKIPEENKPCYVDLESPIFVEILAKLARRGSSLSVQEMLPALEETWLADCDGQTYTSELRLVALDPQAWRAP